MMKNLIQPTPTDLRKFGIIFGIILVILFGIIIPSLKQCSYPWWPWISGGLFGIWSWIHPSSFKYIYFTWLKFGMIMNRINTFILLGLVFYLLVFPIGWIRRLTGTDPMQRKYDPINPSYRIKRKPSTKTYMERPF